MSTAKPGKLGPIELEVIHGTIRAAELEIEAAVERTSRSPMIRDQHDYRVALFDAKGRKLTGRSYSAIVEPVFEYFGEDDIHPGDVFFWNDPYNSCGGIGHVPDLCTTVPIFHEDRLIGFSQVFGHHDDVGGSVPGSLPVHATDSWMEGVLIPPIKLYDRGERNEAAFRIITRNSRLVGASRRRSRCRNRSCQARLAADRGARGALRGGNARGGLRTDPEERRGDIPSRDPAEDQGRRLPLRRLYRGGRGRRASPACTALHDDEDIRQDRARLHRDRSGGEGADQLVARRNGGPLLPQVARAGSALARGFARAGGRDRFQRRRARRHRRGLPGKGHPDHTDLRQADRHALLPDAALAGRLRSVSFESDGRAHASRPRDDPHLGPDGRAKPRRFLPVPRGAGRGRSRPSLGGRLRRRAYRSQFAQPAGGVFGDPLSDHGRATRSQDGFRRRGLPPWRARL